MSTPSPSEPRDEEAKRVWLGLTMSQRRALRSRMRDGEGFAHLFFAGLVTIYGTPTDLGRRVAAYGRTHFDPGAQP